jgi:AbrB family looped-hinge helix DNA binding protein
MKIRYGKGKIGMLSYLRTSQADVRRETIYTSVAHLTPKGQILVPKNLRQKLGLKPGGKVHMAEADGRLILTPVPTDPIEAATGFLKGKFSLTRRSPPRTSQRGST